MTTPQPIPCFGGPMDGKDAPLGSPNQFEVCYPMEQGDKLYYYGGVEIDPKINRGRYTLERFVRREWSERYPTEKEMQEWEDAMAQWRKPIGELSFFRQVEREMFRGKGLSPPMPCKRHIVRDRTAYAFVWEVAANGKAMRPEWEARLRFDDPPWQLDRARELATLNGGVA
jgi:hypothetical protein